MPNLEPIYDTFDTVIKSTWPMLILFIVILIVLRITRAIINQEHMVFYKSFYQLLFILYILLLYYMLLSTEGATSGVNIIPFREITRFKFMSKGFIYNTLGNIALFMPFGYFVSDYLNAKKIRHIFISALATSLTAELIQYKIGRAFDVDDIILNVLGAIVGYIIYKLIQGIKNKLPSFLQNNIFYNILAVLVLAVMTIIFGRMWGLI